MITGQINELAAALAKAQGKIQAAKLDGTNPHFKSKYGTLAAFWDSIRAPLSENGLAVSQIVDAEHGELVTVLMHSSGQYLTSHYALRPLQDTPQGWGSALTYARRYCLAAIVGAVADDDDDGNAASQGRRTVDQTTGEIRTEQAPSNGNGKRPPTEPRPPELLRRYLQDQAESYEQQPELAKGWTGALIGHLDKMTGDQHRLFLMYVFSLATGSAGELNNGQWHALKRWLSLAKDEQGAWYPDAMSVAECKSVMAFMAPSTPAPTDGTQESMLEDAAAANPASSYAQGA